MTAYGGAQCGGFGCGTVFAVTRSGVENVMHAFKGGSDGTEPTAGLVDVGGTFYGVTLSGGSAFSGTVYSITPGGQESVLYTFQGGNDGKLPASQLVYLGGLLYGTTQWGGTGCAACGTVYSIDLSGNETVLYSFQGPFGNGGTQPSGRLLPIGRRWLYGTTAVGGGLGDGGTVFRIAP